MLSLSDRFLRKIRILKLADKSTYVYKEGLIFE